MIVPATAVRRPFYVATAVLFTALAGVAVVLSLAHNRTSMLLARATTSIEYERRLGRDARGFRMVNQHSDASPPAMRGQTQMLTYWEEQTGKPSRQQRWYQWMSNQDAGPMVGALGLAGWDGVDRAHMFAGEPSVLDPKDPRYGRGSPLPRFPENPGEQEWIYRDAPAEMARPYKRTLVEEHEGPAAEAPEEQVVRKAMAAMAVADGGRSRKNKELAAREAGQYSSYGYAGNGGTTYGDKAKWESPIDEVVVLPRSMTIQSRVQQRRSGNHAPYQSRLEQAADALLSQ